VEVRRICLGDGRGGKGGVGTYLKGAEKEIFPPLGEGKPAGRGGGRLQSKGKKESTVAVKGACPQKTGSTVRVKRPGSL